MTSKPAFIARWNDGTHQSAPTTRARAAFLLRAARSRRPLTGETIARLRDGYRIGSLELTLATGARAAA